MDGGELTTRTEILAHLTSSLREALLRSTPGSMSAAEAAAAAERVATGQRLPDQVAARLGDAPALTLVSFDADRIQSWVFASERVPVSAGASKRLDDLNAAVLSGKIVKDLRSRNDGSGVQGVLYSAGGGGMLVADTSVPAEELERAVEGWLQQRSLGLSFTVAAARLTARDLAVAGTPRPLAGGGGRFELLDGLAGALVRLQVEVRRRKEETPWMPRPRAFDARSGEPLERCPSCRQRPPGESPVTGDGIRFWCPQCRDLRGYWKDHGGGSYETEKGHPLTFQDLAGATSLGRGYLGFVAIDGNSMGAVVQGVRTFVELRAFSEATSRIYAEARTRAAEALEHFLPRGADPASAHLSLLSGGDEITLVLPAAAAPRAAIEALRAVESGFDAATAPGGLLAEAFDGNDATLSRLRQAGASCGLIAAQSTFPVRLLRHYAGDLQAGAKRSCAAHADMRSGLAWMLLTDASPLPEGVSTAKRDDEMALVAFERRLHEVAAAQQAGLGRSALQRLIEHGRGEEESLRGLTGRERRETAAALNANFVRYQLARSAKLNDWWSLVRPEDGAEGVDDALRAWLQAGGVDRLERLAQLWSLDPIPPKQRPTRSGGAS